MTFFSRSPSSMKRDQRSRPGRVFCPASAIERLGDRILPTTYIVQTTSDVVGGTIEIKYVGNDTYEVPMLRTAIEQANANAGTDTIQFVDAILGQTITLTSDDTVQPNGLGPTALVVTESVSIQGYSQGTGTKGITIDGAGQRRIFGIGNNVIFTLVNVSLTGGFAQGGDGGAAWDGGGGGGGAGLGGAIYGYGARINLTNVTISGNTAQGGAGGAIEENSGQSAGGGGSAAYDGGIGGGAGPNQQSQRAGGGGGAGMYGPGQNAYFHSGGAGGLNANGGQAGENDSGTLGGGGGGGHFVYAGPFNVVHSGGSANGTNSWGFGGGGGGGSQGSAAFGSANGGNGGFGGGGGGAGYSDGSYRGGQGGFGGGGGGGTGTNKAGGSVFGGGTGGTANPENYSYDQDQGGGGGGGAGLGGAIFLNLSILNMVNTTITGNWANGGAGGGVIESPFALAGNGGSGFGGAIFSLNSNTNIQSSTIANNGASSGGNQVYVLVLGPQATSTAYLANSIVGRTDTSGQPDIIHRAIRGGRLAHMGGIANLVSVPGRFPRRAISATGDPMLGALADNGGTTLTMKPLPGSRAIDAGSTRIRPRFGVLPQTDQTGSPRVQGSGPDIGAVETGFEAFRNLAATRFRRRR